MFVDVPQTSSLKLLMVLRWSRPSLGKQSPSAGRSRRGLTRLWVGSSGPVLTGERFVGGLKGVCLCRLRLLALRGSAAAFGLHPVVCGGLQPEGNQLHHHLLVQRSALCLQSAGVHWEDPEQTVPVHRSDPTAGQRYRSNRRVWVFTAGLDQRWAN